MRVRVRKQLFGAAIAALLIATVPPAGYAPALAEGNDVGAVDAISADNSTEIAFIDGAGKIRVYDHQYQPGKEVQWVSPDGEIPWRNIALGDFDADGDMEIVAVGGGSSGNPSRLAIFDPVVAKGAVVPGQKINNIPWKKLFQIDLPSRPEAVAAGNFDTGIPGDEIIFVRDVDPNNADEVSDPNDKSVMIILKQTVQTNPDGTSWTEHIKRKTGAEFNEISVGNIDRTGGDEVALVDSDNGQLAIYQPDQSFKRLLDEGSTAKPWKDVAIGQYLRGGNLETVAIREANVPLKSFLPFEFQGGTDFEESGAESFDPTPRVVFLGDINGNEDDKEAILLRNISSEATMPRLIVRNDGSDKIIESFEKGLPLESDNRYRNGVASDIDGDNRDEIILLSETNLLFFLDAHTSDRTNSKDLSAVKTNRRSIVAGDMDKNGYIEGPVFATDTTLIEAEVFSGFSTSGSFALSNSGTSDAIPFNMTVETGTWLTLSPAFGNTPSTIRYTINAATLPFGSVPYTTRIRIDSSRSDVTNDPYYINVSVLVKQPPFGIIETQPTLMIWPCPVDPVDRSLTLNMTGIPGTRFTGRVLPPALGAEALGEGFYVSSADSSGNVTVSSAGAADVVFPAGSNQALWASQAPSNTIVSEVPWVVSAVALTNTVPTTITLTISPTLAPAKQAQAQLFLQGTQLIDGSIPFQVSTIFYNCADSVILAPIVPR